MFRGSELPENHLLIQGQRGLEAVTLAEHGVASITPGSLPSSRLLLDSEGAKPVISCCMFCVALPPCSLLTQVQFSLK